MTSQLMLSYRIFPEYRVITEYLEPTRTIGNRKSLNFDLALVRADNIRFGVDQRLMFARFQSGWLKNVSKE